MKKEHSILFEPIKIGNVEIKNRFVMAPMGPGGMSDESGAFNQRGVDYYVERAKAGVGLIIVGTTIVENEIEKRNLPFMPCPTLNPGAFIGSSKLMTERVHAYDAKIFIQLTAGFGRVINPKCVPADFQLIGPSVNPSRWDPEKMTRELTTQEVKTLVMKMAEAAAICKVAGFDGIEIHAVHEGYLLDQFTMEFLNRRTDEYGGSLMNRLRFPIEIVQAIKEACGQDFPVALRYSLKHFIKDFGQGGLPGEDFVEMGRDIEEGLEVAKILEKAGYDAFDGDVGCYDSWYWSHPPAYLEKGMYLPYNEQLKKVLKVPVITAGRLEDPDLASAAILEGKTDMIGLGRPLLADAYVVKKIRDEKIDDIRPCLSCHEGCLIRLGVLLSCAVNPTTGREKELAIEKSNTVKEVMVVGGGIAGCEAARVCALRGHKVSLFEKNDQLGGNLIPGGVPDFKEDDRKLVKWYKKQLKDLNVGVHYNSSVTKEFIENNNPDVLIVATGSTPKVLTLPNSMQEKIVTASDVLTGKKDAGNSTVILGGGLVGCEVALWLVKLGKTVTIVETLDDILSAGHEMCPSNEMMLRDLLNYHQVDIKTGVSITSVNQVGAVIKTEKGEEIIPADSVILAVGYNADQTLYQQVKNNAVDTYLLGDARKVQNIMYAIWDAYEVSRFI